MASSASEKTVTIPFRVASLVVIFAFILFSSFTFALPARAQDDTMRHTLKSTVYGGVIGGLIGTAVLLVSDNPEDKLSYIPTGVGVGLLLGAAYGLATGGIYYSAAVEAGPEGVDFHVPRVSRIAFYDENTASIEVINKMDLLKVRF